MPDIQQHCESRLRALFFFEGLPPIAAVVNLIFFFFLFWLDPGVQIPSHVIDGKAYS